MLSILVLVHDAPRFVLDTLNSLIATCDQMRSEQDFELILIDDCSDPKAGIVDLFKKFRAATRTPVQIIRFKTHQHYGHGLAYGFAAAAKGSSVLFISHDMILNPECVRTMLELSALRRVNGIIRPVSQHMDFAPEMTIQPPLPLRNPGDVRAFAKLMRRRFMYDNAQWAMLIGDAMLVTRNVIDAIGVPDMRFFGFMADIDYGIRARRAGFDLLIARGAWLHHVGGGHCKEAGRDEAGQRAIRVKYVADAERAWLQFRQKWGTNIPSDYRHLDATAMTTMVKTGAVDGSSDYHAPPALDPAICEIH